MSGVLFIDLKSAFDTVSHDKLLEKVRLKKIFTEEEFTLAEFLLRNSHIAIGENIMQIRRGIPQGSIISPLLFDIYLDDLSQ